MGSVDVSLAYPVEKFNSGKHLAAMRRTMRDWGNEYLRRLVETRMSGRSGDMGVNRRTGNLARDWIVTAEETPVGMAVAIASHGTADRYAGLQEYGGTIRPKSAKRLWIPLRENQTAKGVQRMTPRQAIQQGGFIKGGVFFGVSGSKSKKSANFKITPLFALKSSVRIPPRLGAGSLFRSMLPTLESGITYAVQGAWANA